MTFEYDQQRVFIGSLEVDDPGNMCIRCVAETGEEYFIFTKSILGKLNLIKIGPILDGLNTFLDNFNVEYKKTDFKENFIQKEVQAYINDPRKKIQLVEELNSEDAYNRIFNVIDVFKNIE